MHRSARETRVRRLAAALPVALVVLFTGASTPRAESPPAAPDEKNLSGMSIVGNDEAPKSLVIVPWKSSDLGDTLDVSRDLDDGLRPVDRDVFSRELDYFEIRTGNRQ